MNKTEELKQKSKEELVELLQKEREKVREFRFRVASRELKTVKDIIKVKKSIARIQTILKGLK